jgi:cellulose biosynthesis protein BcsQ
VPRTIVFANQKGGFVRTSLYLQTAGEFIEAGHNILIVDLDCLGKSPRHYRRTYIPINPVADVLLGSIKAPDVIQQTASPARLKAAVEKLGYNLTSKSDELEKLGQSRKN